MKKAATIGAVILIILFCGTTGYAFYVYHSVHNAIKKESNDPLKNQRFNKDLGKNLQEDKPVSFLLLGGDERQSDSGRTDTMVVVTVNPKQKSMKMLSIPRDTLTAIPGHKQDKINAAYAYGGVELSVKTVERMLKIPIDYYIKLNMDGFKDLIDAIGGVTVSNDLPFSFGGYHFKKGMVNLNTGDKALAFIRMRKQDPNGDFGREERQRKVIAAVAKKEINLSGLKNLPNILGALGSNVKTNLTLNDLEMIIKDNKSVSKNIQTLHLKGEEKIINGVWYYDIPNDELNSVSDELRSHLDLPERDNQDGNQKNPQGC